MKKCVTESKNRDYAKKIEASAEFGREQDKEFPVHDANGNRRLA